MHRSGTARTEQRVQLDVFSVAASARMESVACSTTGGGEPRGRCQDGSRGLAAKPKTRTRVGRQQSNTRELTEEPEGRRFPQRTISRRLHDSDCYDDEDDELQPDDERSEAEV